MKQLLGFLLVVIVAVGFSLAANYNPGQVAVFYPPYRIDFSLNLAIVFSVLGFLLLYGLVRAVSGAIQLPERVKEFKASRRREGAHRALREAVLALTEGRYSKVERLAYEAAVEKDDGEPAALLAALAAQRLEEYERRDKWLAPILVGDEPLAHAAKLVHAEALSQQRKFDAALAVITPLMKTSRRHVRALQIALKIYQGADRWEDVLRVVRLLSNRGALHAAVVESLTVEVYEHLAASRAGDAYALTALWRNAQAKETTMPGVAKVMGLAFSRASVGWQARTIIEQALAVQWDAGLVKAYAEVAVAQPLSGLDRAESWLNAHPDDPALLETLGKLCVSQQLWGKALKYYEKLFDIAPTPAAAANLAMLCEKHGDLAKEEHYTTKCLTMLIYNAAT
jgi:HemY protein